MDDENVVYLHDGKPTDERVINTWYPDTMEHYSLIKKDAPTKFSGKQLGLEKMKLSE